MEREQALDTMQMVVCEVSSWGQGVPNTLDSRGFGNCARSWTFSSQHSHTRVLLKAEPSRSAQSAAGQLRP